MWCEGVCGVMVCVWCDGVCGVKMCVWCDAVLEEGSKCFI